MYLVHCYILMPNSKSDYRNVIYCIKNILSKKKIKKNILSKLKIILSAVIKIRLGSFFFFSAFCLME